MKTITIALPAMYADHHVSEVRRLLFELAGVEEIYASSGFRSVEVRFDEGKVQAERIEAVLDEAGYLGELPIPVESESGERKNGQRAFFRHSAAYEKTRDTVSFGQKVPYQGRPLWPCPGLGPIGKES